MMPYHITINAFHRMHLFGIVRHAKMFHSIYGQIAEECIDAIPLHFPFIRIDTKIVLPNHCHILLINDGIPEGSRSTIGSIIGAYKSSVSRIIHQSLTNPPDMIWQRGSDFRPIESAADLHNTRAYILDNPKNWKE